MTDFISVVCSSLFELIFGGNATTTKRSMTSEKKMLKYESRGDVSREIGASGDCLENDK